MKIENQSLQGWFHPKKSRLCKTEAPKQNHPCRASSKSLLITAVEAGRLRSFRPHFGTSAAWLMFLMERRIQFTVFPQTGGGLMKDFIHKQQNAHHALHSRCPTSPKVKHGGLATFKHHKTTQNTTLKQKMATETYLLCFPRRCTQAISPFRWRELCSRPPAVWQNLRIAGSFSWGSFGCCGISWLPRKANGRESEFLTTLKVVKFEVWLCCKKGSSKEK